MLRVIDTGDITYVYASSEQSKAVVSAVPMHLQTTKADVKNFKFSQAFKSAMSSPKYRQLAARNAKLFNHVSYEYEDEYTLALRRMLEILPGDKTALFFGGDFLSLEELTEVIKIAKDIQFKTWILLCSDSELLNNYCLNLMMKEEELPPNVWLYELSCSEAPNWSLHDFPSASYELQQDRPEDEILQLPTEYKSFSIKVWNP